MLLSSKRVVFTQDRFQTLTHRAMVVMKIMTLAMSTRVTGLRACLMVKESRRIRTAIGTRDRLCMVKNLDMECITLLMEESMRELSTTTRLMVKVKSVIQIQVVTMESGNWVNFMVRGSLNGQMDRPTMGNICKDFDMVEENTISETVVTTMEAGRMVCSREEAVFMKDMTTLKENGIKDSLLGNDLKSFLLCLIN